MRGAFVYLITEGVTDVTLINQVLRHYLSMTPVEKRADLPAEAKRWLEGFTWPVGEAIARLAVPAPVFMQREGVLVAVRNARGLSGIKATLEADDEALVRIDWRPDALGVLLDADDKSMAQRLTMTCKELMESDSFPGLTCLKAVAEIAAAEDGRRFGVFVFPDAKEQGTVEDLLLPLGEAAFPELHAASQDFVESWNGKHGHEEQFKELGKPAGVSKAKLSAMASLLKPGKNVNASLHDQEWVPAGGLPDVLKPLFGFLEALIEDR